MTSYLFLSMALKTEAAESKEISCSPLRPPKRMPTRSFFILFSVAGRRRSRQSSGMTVWVRAISALQKRRNVPVGTLG
jgi:hypothetical protein